ncbi:hypothetical protein HNQ34_002748 [Anoxybacillus tepidamans]|uniref:Uncharacterized protein n=1 Tax=Anoxybacteroides tepidamans TaxID=265948 RepID=A0A7W8MVI8_9BACL|nr:hypothetical protein [Anoxybacillus tepidamans]
MSIMVWGSILAILLVLILLLIYISKQKQLREKDEYIDSLQQKLTELHDKLKKMEKRRAFRINLLEPECIFELIACGDQLLKRLKHKKGKGKIKDISLTGVKLECDYDLPVRNSRFNNCCIDCGIHFFLW